MAPRAPRARKAAPTSETPETPDLKSLMHDLLTEVDSRIAAASAQVVANLGPTITARLTQDLNNAIARLSAQVTDGLKGVASSAAMSPTVIPDPKADAVDKVTKAAREIATLLETLLDSAAPKIIGLMGQMQAQKLFGLANPETAAAFRQQYPYLAPVIGQQLVGVNVNEQAIANAMLSGATIGARLTSTIRGGAPSLSPATPSPAAPSASSSGVPSSPGLPTPGTPQPSNVSMSNGTQPKPARLRDVL